jgi:hypothetical protein
MVSPKNYKRRPIAAAMSLTCGKQNEAILFSEVWDFFIRSHAVASGKKVIIQTDDQLCYRTGLSFDQIRRAKRELVSWGYFQTWQAISHQYHHGLTVTHIHLPDALVQLMTELVMGATQICTTGTAQNCIGDIVQGCPLPLYIREVSKGKISSLSPEVVLNEQQQLDHLKEMFNE